MHKNEALTQAFFLYEALTQGLFFCMRQGTTYEYFATCPVGEDKPLPYVA
jgi:hypothetical protein